MIEQSVCIGALMTVAAMKDFPAEPGLLTSAILTCASDKLFMSMACSVSAYAGAVPQMNSAGAMILFILSMECILLV